MDAQPLVLTVTNSKGNAEMDLTDCPKFPSCNAALCPLGWDTGTAGIHLAGERVCGIALELVKPDGSERARTAYPAEVCAEVERVLPAIRERYSDIDHRLADTATRGSRIEAGRKMAKARR
jgi:hypothetical protein